MRILCYWATVIKSSNDSDWNNYFANSKHHSAANCLYLEVPNSRQLIYPEWRHDLCKLPFIALISWHPNKGLQVSGFILSSANTYFINITLFPQDSSKSPRPIKKFLPRKKTERKTSDDEFLLRKSRYIAIAMVLPTLRL